MTFLPTVLSPRAFALLIKHLDSIDQAVAKKLNRDTPWEETFLTRFFCDLFDQQGQEDEKLSYTTEQLEEDLAAADEPLSVNWRISPKTYTPFQENRVTQSDIGLSVEYRDQFDSSRSFTTYHLLQAKRLFHSSSGRYDEASRFDSHNDAQHKRLEQLERALGRSVLKYLLYCPRPSSLAPDLRQLLTYHRTRALETQIFDYVPGAALHADMLNGQSTIAAGIFVSGLNPAPSGLVDLHRTILCGSSPFSWFVANQFVDRKVYMTRDDHVPAGSNSPASDDVLRRLVEADPDVIKELKIDWKEPATVLPARSVTLSVTASPEASYRQKRGKSSS